MRIAYITAGAAGRYCGACKRDVGLTRALIERGHNMLLLPLYTPLQTDEPDPSLDRVFFGALNVYLQQQCSIFRRTPRSVDWLLDRPSLLRFVSGLGVETEAEELGEMTVSVLRGSEGMQRKELDKLLDFLEDEGPFDVVNLSNSLFSGFAAPIGERLGLRWSATCRARRASCGTFPRSTGRRPTSCCGGTPLRSRYSWLPTRHTPMRWPTFWMSRVRR